MRSSSACVSGFPSFFFFFPLPVDFRSGLPPWRLVAPAPVYETPVPSEFTEICVYSFAFLDGVCLSANSLKPAAETLVGLYTAEPLPVY